MKADFNNMRTQLTGSYNNLVEVLKQAKEGGMIRVPLEDIFDQVDEIGDLISSLNLLHDQKSGYKILPLKINSLNEEEE